MVDVLNPVERFWSHTEQVGDCLIWTASVRENGYGEVGWQGKTMLAHRVAWLITYGSLPTLPLDHLADRCDSRACVNPAHLEPVTQAENNRRANARRNYATGRSCARAGTTSLTRPTCEPGIRKSGVACRVCHRGYSAAHVLRSRTDA